MANRESRNGPAHMAPRGGKKKTDANRRTERPKREALHDNYYYEETENGFEDVSSYSSPQKKREDRRELERQRGKEKMSTAKKAIIGVSVALVLLIGVGVWYVFGYVLGGLTVEPITKDPVKLGWTTGSSVSGNEDDFQVVLDDSVTNIAMFGVDARDSSFEGRSDVIMILTVDNKHGKIKMTSIARDTCVDIDGYGYDKFAHAYVYGGYELAVNTLNRNFHLRIEDYVTVNFAKMADIIDAVGGIDLYLTWEEVREINRNLFALSQEIKEEGYEDGPLIEYDDYFKDADGNRVIETDNYEDGDYHLNGNQAVAYGRIRHLEGGDDVRMERQQTVLKALIQKVKGKSKLEYPEMIRKIMPMCKTSLDFGDITKMLPIIFTDFEIETITLPTLTEGPYGRYIRPDCWVYLYDLEAASKHISQFIYESDSPYYNEEIIPSDPGIPTVDPGGTDVYDPDAGDDSWLTSSSSSEASSSSSEASSSSGLGEDPSSSSGSSSWPEGSGASSSWPEGSGTSSSGWTEDPGTSSGGLEEPGGSWSEGGGEAGESDNGAYTGDGDITVAGEGDVVDEADIYLEE